MPMAMSTGHIGHQCQHQLEVSAHTNANMDINLKYQQYMLNIIFISQWQHQSRCQ
jgi:hypothetical protein